MQHEPLELFICAGKTYMRALDRIMQNVAHLTIARGGQGEKLASLKAWLNHSLIPV